MRDRRAVARALWHDPEALQRDGCAELRVMGHVLAFLSAFLATLPVSFFATHDQPALTFLFVFFDCTVDRRPYHVPDFPRPDILIVWFDRVVVVEVDELQHGIWNGFAHLGSYLIPHLLHALRNALTTRIDHVPRRFELGYNDMERFPPGLEFIDYERLKRLREKFERGPAELQRELEDQLASQAAAAAAAERERAAAAAERERAAAAEREREWAAARAAVAERAREREREWAAARAAAAERERAAAAERARERERAAAAERERAAARAAAGRPGVMRRVPDFHRGSLSYGRPVPPGTDLALSRRHMR
eukprot:tig00000128_g7224.t1